jgi:hypothetical protein
MIPLSKRASSAALLALALLGAPSPAPACSICRCGDPTFNALGKDGYAARGFRAALDWERFDKDEGDHAEESESQVENRFTALASYGFGERFTLFARVPYSVRDLQASMPGEAPETTETHGFSDPEIYGQFRLWASPASSLGRRTSLSLNAGVKTPWGQNDVQQDGTRVDEHAQPGTGSTDVFGSLALLHLIDARSALFVSSGYRHTGENDLEYRYGSSFTANLAYERKLSKVFDSVLELNFRHAQKDTAVAHHHDGEEADHNQPMDDENTGGSLLYVTPRLLADLGGGLVLRASAQIPVAKDLNGFQKERTVVNVGLSYLFSH